MKSETTETKRICIFSHQDNNQNKGATTACWVLQGQYNIDTITQTIGADFYNKQIRDSLKLQIWDLSSEPWYKESFKNLVKQYTRLFVIVISPEQIRSEDLKVDSDTMQENAPEVPILYIVNCNNWDNSLELKLADNMILMPKITLENPKVFGDALQEKILQMLKVIPTNAALADPVESQKCGDKSQKNNSENAKTLPISNIRNNNLFSAPRLRINIKITLGITMILAAAACVIAGLAISSSAATLFLIAGIVGGVGMAMLLASAICDRSNNNLLG